MRLRQVSEKMPLEQRVGGNEWAVETPGERAFRQGDSKGEGHDKEISWCI